MWFSGELAYCESTDHINGVVSVCIDCAHARDKDLGSRSLGESAVRFYGLMLVLHYRRRKRHTNESSHIQDFYQQDPRSEVRDCRPMPCRLINKKYYKTFRHGNCLNGLVLRVAWVQAGQ